MRTLGAYLHYVSPVTLIWMLGIAGGIGYVVWIKGRPKTGLLVVAVSLFILSTDLLAVDARMEITDFKDGTFQRHSYKAGLAAYFLLVICGILAIGDFLHPSRPPEQTAKKPEKERRKWGFGNRDKPSSKEDNKTNKPSPTSATPSSPSQGSTGRVSINSPDKGRSRHGDPQPPSS